MKTGDLVRFCPEIWGNEAAWSSLGIVLEVDFSGPAWPTIATVLFPTDDLPYSSKVEDFEVVNENW